MFSQADTQKEMCEVVDVLANSMGMGDFFTISNISNYHIVHFKYLIILIFNYTLKKLKRENCS